MTENVVVSLDLTEAEALVVMHALAAATTEDLRQRTALSLRDVMVSRASVEQRVIAALNPTEG